AGSTSCSAPARSASTARGGISVTLLATPTGTSCARCPRCAPPIRDGTMSLEKIVILCWDSQKRAPAELGRVLLQDLAPKLLEAGAEKLQINVSDEHADVKSPALRGPFDDPFVAQVNVWLKVVDDRWPIEDVLRRAGFELAAYHVSESIYTDYGDNEHAGP